MTLDERGTIATQQPRRIRIVRNLGQLRKRPADFLDDVGRQLPNGEIGEIRLGPKRAVLVTDPDHLQQVFVTERDRYSREGMIWRPMSRLTGTGLAGDGAPWKRSRSLMAPLFQRSRIESLMVVMSRAIDEAVNDLDVRMAGEESVDGLKEMTRIVHTALIRAFFGDRISLSDAARLGAATVTAFGALGARLLMPFVPNAVPMPGDRRFMRAVRVVDEIMLPLVRESMVPGADGEDIVTWLAQDNHKIDVPLTEQEIRDNVVALFVGGTETTSLALTWLWTRLADEPAVAGRLAEEVGRVVGSDVPGPRHLAGLDYVRRTLQETLRLHPGSFVLPRSVVAHDTIGGVAVRPGDMVIVSPYLTHRLAHLWPDARTFDPDRFLPERSEGRHKLAYFPFGAGGHKCIGEHLYVVEAQMLAARILRDYTPEVLNARDVWPRPDITLPPNVPVRLRLTRRT
ncbi:cytochrome P450 [Longispora sp. K20-0274]|uniref:cytochrome P450 n=1 Tax=Longispora sp. K20-0274 TaxID=3088255 RepID=UPI00399B77F0